MGCRSNCSGVKILHKCITDERRSDDGTENRAMQDTLAEVEATLRTLMEIHKRGGGYTIHTIVSAERTRYEG